MTSKIGSICPSLLAGLLAVARITVAQVGPGFPVPAYSCCESKIKFQQAIKPELETSTITPAAAGQVTLEAVFRFPISFDCALNLGSECVAKFDVAVTQSPLQADAQGAFTVAPIAPGGQAAIIGYPQEPCDGKSYNDKVYVRWRATYPTANHVAGNLVLTLTMPPGFVAKGSINHTFTAFGFFDGTSLRFVFNNGLAPPVPAVPTPPGFTCCESNIAVGPGAPTIVAINGDNVKTPWHPAGRPADSREVRIKISVPINFDCDAGADGQQCIGRFDVATDQNPQQGAAGARVGPIVAEVKVTKVVVKTCGTGHQTGSVEVEWSGVYPGDGAVTGNLRIRLTTLAAKGGLDQNLDVPNVNTGDGTGRVRTNPPTTSPR